MQRPHVSGKLTAISLTALFAISVSCGIFDEEKAGDEDQKLTVKFENSSTSTFTICSIELQGMGTAGSSTPTPSGSWSANILSAADSIPPGSDITFTTDIPSGDYSQYRLGVFDENGVRVLLHEQDSTTVDMFQGTITYWGSDERTVTATVQRNPHTGFISVTSYADWAGIE